MILMKRWRPAWHAHPLTDADMRLGFSQVIVMGCARAKQQMRRLPKFPLDGAHKMRGVAFVPQGAKTNNTTDNPL
jgi:hypothetical protein